MKLFILSNNPNRASFRQRIGIYVDTLRSAGINCEVAKLPTSRIKRFKLFKQAANFDAVFLHKKGLNPLDAFCLRIFSKKLIFNFDDAVMYSDKTPGRNSLSHFIPFRRSVKLADMVIVGSNYLAEYARKFNSNVKVLPLGLNTSDYKVGHILKNDDKIRLVWIGSSSTLNYLEQIKPVLAQIGSDFDNIVLRIIGDTFFDLENMEVEKRVWKKETRGIDLAECDIGLAPLPDNRFTRGKCSFKVLEYSAAGLPVVASPVGTNSLHVCENVTGFLAKNPQEWIDKISNLIEDEKLRKEMGDAGIKQAKKFDRKIIGLKLCEILTEFVEKTEPVAVSVTPSITTEPKVSVCIPTYNRKDYLKETIDSILAQTYQDYEIVIVDDGSTDGTEEMVKKLDFPVTYYWQKNAGDAAARNKLIELAKGDYISFIDSDDLLMPDAIERMVRVMETEAEEVIVYGSYYRIDETGNIYGKCKRRLYSGNITKHLFKVIFVHACGSMFPKKILKEPMVFDTSLKVCSDYDLWLTLSLDYRFIALDYPTFKRRRHLNNLSYPSFENCLTEFQVLKRFYYEKGGKEVIPEKTAMKVFSKEGRRIGHCAIKEGLHDQAIQFLSQSFRQHPNLKSLISWIRAMIVKQLAS